MADGNLGIKKGNRITSSAYDPNACAESFIEKFDHGAGGKQNSIFFSPEKAGSVRPGTIPHATSDIRRTLHESKGIISPLDDLDFYTAQHREDFFNANIFKLKESEIFDNGVYRFEVALINTPDREKNSIGLQLNCRISSQTTRPIFNFKIEIFADKSKKNFLF